jgi:EVE domain
MRYGRSAEEAAMADWLVKTEPAEYSFEDLKKAGRAAWDGVANPLTAAQYAFLAGG